MTGKWVRARYRVTLHELAAHYAEWEIIGPPEIRDVDANARYFNPARREARADSTFANLGPILTITGSRPTRRVAFAGTAG